MRLPVHALYAYISLSLLIVPFFTEAQTGNAAGITIEKLIETEKSWDGVVYQAYPKGTPQLTVLKITIAPNTRLAWHEHPIPNAAYVLSGVLTVEKKANGEMHTLKAGQVLAEMVDSAHRGFTGKEGATVIVFYAGQKGLPLSKAAE